MARRNALSAALVAAVLLGHALVLEWLARQAQEQAALQQMATPLFTRLLQPQAPPPAPRPAPRPAKPRPARAAAVIQSVAQSTPQQATTTVAAPEPPVPSPPQTAAAEPAPGPVAASEPATDTPTAPLTPAPDLAAPEAAASASRAPQATTAAVPSQATLDSWPADTRLSYQLGGYFRGELHGSAHVQWQREAERYQTRIDIDLGIISMVMTSQGVVTDQGLAPSAYEEARAGKRRTTLLQDGTVILSDGSQVPRPDGVQDTASQFVELSHRFASGQLPLEVGRSAGFWMARPGGVDFWIYDVVDKEVLQTPQFGPVEAFHLKPRPVAAARGSVTAEMWFAPSLQYLPVRIRVTTGEAWLDLLVEKIEQR